MENPQYLVLVEIGRTAFIAGLFTDFEKAEFLTQELLRLGDIFCSVNEKEKILSVLNQKDYISYHMYGNQFYFPNPDAVCVGCTDAHLTVWAIKIDMKDYHIQYFISERQYYSRLFEWDRPTRKYSDYEFLPHYSIAN